MKPLRLEFQGIKSYTEKTVIDFEKLLGNGIFGIFGNTGSGKSTILDCVLLSLYARTSASREATDFVSFASTEGRVDFTFSMLVGGVRKVYRVWREFKLRLPRKAGTHKAMLTEIKDDSEIPVAEGADRVSAKLSEIIGLEIDDFEKCIILPQGEFASFVSMSRIPRLNMMSSLFNLEKYGDRLISSVKGRWQDSASELNVQKAKLETYSEATKEKLDALNDELNSVRQEEITHNVIFLKIKDKFEEIKNFYDTRNKLINLKEQLEKALKQESLVEKKRKCIDLFYEAKNALKSLKEIEKTNEEISVLKVNAVKAEEKLSGLYNDLKEVLEEKEKLSSKDALSESLVEKLGALKSVENDYKELEEKEKELRLLRNEYQLLKNEKGKLSELKINLEKQLSEIENEEETNGYRLRLDDTLNMLEGSASGALVKSEIEFLKELLDGLDAINRDKVSARISHLESFCSGGKEVRVLIDELRSLYEKIDLEAQKKQSVTDRINEVSRNLSDVENKLDGNLSQGKRLGTETGKINDKIAKITSGKNYADCIDELRKKISAHKADKENNQNREKQINDGINYFGSGLIETNSKLKERESRVSLLKKEYLNAVNEKFSNDFTVESVIESVPDLDSAKSFVQNFDNEIYSLRSQILQLESEIGDNFVDELVYENAKDEYDRANLKAEELKIKCIDLSKRREILSQKFAERCIIENKLREIEKDFSLYGKLYEVVKSKALVEFVADEYLKEIAFDASKTLLGLTNGNFGLCYNGEFFVEDNIRGGEKRRVNTVSGGELFLVSLSLALSLSRSIYAKSLRPIEFFFLDEGFGSLDSELVDTVIDSLTKLVSSDLTIGVISHVDSLKERITAKILVRGATEKSGSSLQITV